MHVTLTLTCFMRDYVHMSVLGRIHVCICVCIIANVRACVHGCIWRGVCIACTLHGRNIQCDIIVTFARMVTHHSAHVRYIPVALSKTSKVMSPAICPT